MTAKKRVPKNLEIAMIDYDENPDAPRGAARNTETLYTCQFCYEPFVRESKKNYHQKNCLKRKSKRKSSIDLSSESGLFSDPSFYQNASLDEMTTWRVLSKDSKKSSKSEKSSKTRSITTSCRSSPSRDDASLISDKSSEVGKSNGNG